MRLENLEALGIKQSLESQIASGVTESSKSQGIDSGSV